MGIKKEGKFLLFSDSGSDDSTFSVNWMGLAIGLIIALFFVQLARPGFQQIGDFMSAIYSPYTSYGQDELNRYDTYYGDYNEEAAGASRQFRQFTEASNLLSKIINGHDAGASNSGTENLALNTAPASNPVPLIN